NGLLVLWVKTEADRILNYWNSATGIDEIRKRYRAGKKKVSGHGGNTYNDPEVIRINTPSYYVLPHPIE
ncbi:hypothetical protein LJB84_03275, partial [Bacteroidales bacterium OttesenSCG-928-J19]|nr:hypothetical protein [Bacteroidales bacterium OttesenSCG-928-J19]